MMPIPPNLRRFWYLPLVVAALAMLLWLGSMTHATLSLLASLRGAKELASAPLEADPASVDALLKDVRADVVRLDRGLGWAMPIAARLGWFPTVGPLIAQAPAGLDFADALTELGILFWEDLSPSFVQYQQGVSAQRLLPEVVSAFANNKEVKLGLAQQSAVACQDLEPAVLPAQIGGLVAQLCEWMPLAVDGIGAADAFPRVLGIDEPQTYLVLALNEDELRPGGGFITGVGEVRVSDGRVLAMDFQDSYAVDDFSLPYPDPPEALRAFMAVDLLVFRDSNWSPDFPSSAQQAIELYRPGYPVDIAGVIGIDQAGVSMLVEAVGPLVLPGADAPVSGEALLDYIHAAWAPEDGQIDRDWWQQRKNFMADVAGVAVNRIQSGDVDMSNLARALLATLNQRHLQVYLVDDDAAAFLANQGWDGGLAKADGDFLMAVEANLGYNKVSTNIARFLSYEVDLRQHPPYANVRLEYRHLSQREAACVPEIRYDPDYLEMTHRCYWAYVRLILPDGARLLDGTETTIASDQMYTGRTWTGEITVTEVQTREAFGQGFLLPTSAEQTLSFVYQLPDHVVTQEADGTHRYRLYVQKQAGIPTLPVSVTLHMPGNAVVLSAHPETVAERNGVLLFETIAESDVELSV
ncbi:MAG: DUF4012 domain-containing protein, partial [Anaerolineae bacterium]|nr:DUF4012 domain-containing protein [Anaerolineae bacterium]